MCRSLGPGNGQNCHSFVPAQRTCRALCRIGRPFWRDLLLCGGLCTYTNEMAVASDVTSGDVPAEVMSSGTEPNEWRQKRGNR